MAKIKSNSMYDRLLDNNHVVVHSSLPRPVHEYKWQLLYHGAYYVSLMFNLSIRCNE
jgi:hypothetical protein